MSKSYIINEIFASLQGEGVRAGTANIFVRFSGCNLSCKKEEHPDENNPQTTFDCDTEFVSGRKMTAREIVNFCEEIAPQIKNVILTGGEPGLQVDVALCKLLKERGYYVVIETNGTIDLRNLCDAENTLSDLIDWITLSPKVAEHALRQLSASEIKYVRGYGQAIPKPRAAAQHYVISPAFEGNQLDEKTLKWCIDLVKENPKWRLSVQQHKGWVVR